MKAPEKIYLRKRTNLPLEVVRDKGHETVPQSLFGSVEYVRTDAFLRRLVMRIVKSVKCLIVGVMSANGLVNLKDI